MSIEVTGPLRMTPFWRFIQRVAEFIALVLFRWRVTVEGLDNVPRDRGAVLVYNHHGYFDFVMVAWNIVRKHRRPPRFLAKRELWNSWKTRWIMHGATAVPVERGSSTGRHGALDAAVSALRAGDLVAVAPEQTISQSFDLLPLKSGAVRMAQEAGVPIIPVAGWGSHRFCTKGRKPQWAARIPVTVRYGEPIMIAPNADVHAATDHVAATLQALVDEVQRSYPDGTPEGAWWVPARLGGGAPPHHEVLRAHRDRASREFVEGRQAADEGQGNDAGRSNRAS
jgi:1-acyl-sn-glycerol-3-phosphate acyltransferase